MPISKIILGAVALGTVACGSELSIPTAPLPQTPTPPTPESSITDAFPTVCPGDRPFTFAISGQGYEEFEGGHVRGSVVEPVGSPHTNAPINVSISTLIQSGGFELECAHGVSDNGLYPSFALLIDADGDQRCGNEDLISLAQFYAWGEDQVYTVDRNPPEDHWSPAGQWRRIGDLPPYTWGEKSLCEFYFPDPQD